MQGNISMQRENHPLFLTALHPSGFPHTHVMTHDILSLSKSQNDP